MKRILNNKIFDELIKHGISICIEMKCLKSDTIITNYNRERFFKVMFVLCVCLHHES